MLPHASTPLPPRDGTSPLAILESNTPAESGGKVTSMTTLPERAFTKILEAGVLVTVAMSERTPATRAGVKSARDPDKVRKSFAAWVGEWEGDAVDGDDGGEFGEDAEEADEEEAEEDAEALDG